MSSSATTAEEPTTPADGATDEEPTAAATGPERGGILRVALTGDPSTLDPWFADDETDLTVIDQLHDGLVHLDLSGQVVPALAERWWFGAGADGPSTPQLDEDGLLAADDARVLTFRLRADATFHDGTPVTATDVARGLRGLAQRPDGQAAPYAYLLAGLLDGDGQLPDDAVQALDDRHLRLVAPRPAGGLLELLAHPAVAPRHPAAPDTEDTMPVGAGPFALAQEPVPDEFVRLGRHEGWGAGPAGDGGPWLDELIFRVYTGDETQQAQFADLLAGRVDVARVPATRRDEARDALGAAPHPNRGPGFITGVAASTWAYGFDLGQPTFGRDGPARAAVRAAIDTDELADDLLDGSRAALHGPLSPGLPGARVDACGDRCGRAALETSEPLPDAIEVVHDAGPPQDAIAATVARQLSEALDIEAASRAVPAGDYLQTLVEQPPPGPFRLAWVPDVPTMGAALTPRFHSREVGGNNLVRLADEAVDDLLDRADRAPDPGTRQDLLLAAEDAVIDTAAVVPLVADRLDLGVTSTVRGLEVDAIGRIDLGAAWVATG